MSSFVSALAVRLRVASNPGTRAVAVYLALVPASTFTSTVVGSLSEYRFPHPLLTTTLHLAISLSTLLALALAAKIALRSSFSRRQLSTKSTSAPTSSPLLTDVLTALSSHLPSCSITTRHLAESLTPFILSSSLAAVLASLVELRAARIAEPPFWTLARLLPLVITAAAGAFSPTDTPGALEDVNAPNVVVGVLVWLVLMAGPAVGWRASGEGWVCGVVYAVAVVGWVLSVKGGMKEGEEVGQDGEPKSSPTIVLYLTIALCLLFPPLLMSDELKLAYQSGHFGFFTEAGFWLQELVMAWCGLASLASFWSLIKHVDPLTVFLVVALKDAAVPSLYSSAFSNPLSMLSKPALNPHQQALALAAIGLYHLVDLKLDKVEASQQKAQ